jgi:hypothetical protein
VTRRTEIDRAGAASAISVSATAPCSQYCLARVKPAIGLDLLIVSSLSGVIGIVQYYLLAGDVYQLSRLHWVMLLLKSLAGKHDSTVSTRPLRSARAITAAAGKQSARSM